MNEIEREKQHQEDLQRIRGFRLIDDDFMNACFDGNIAGTELILRIILNKPDISVKRVETQKLMKNLLGRDVWLDIDATDSNNAEYDIEVQRADKGADRKRARYHSSMLDSHCYSLMRILRTCPKPMLYLLRKMMLLAKINRYIR